MWTCPPAALARPPSQSVVVGSIRWMRGGPGAEQEVGAGKRAPRKTLHSTRMVVTVARQKKGMLRLGEESAP